MDVRLNDASPLRRTAGSSSLPGGVLPGGRSDGENEKASPDAKALSQDKDVLEQALGKAEKMAQVFGRNLKFRYMEDAGIVQVTVIDAGTDEVIRKIPPDEVVRLVEHIHDMFGAMLDVKA
jgi:flagellar protein FlaG